MLLGVKDAWLRPLPSSLPLCSHQHVPLCLFMCAEPEAARAVLIDPGQPVFVKEGTAFFPGSSLTGNGLLTRWVSGQGMHPKKHRGRKHTPTQTRLPLIRYPASTRHVQRRGRVEAAAAAGQPGLPAQRHQQVWAGQCGSNSAS